MTEANAAVSAKAGSTDLNAGVTDDGKTVSAPADSTDKSVDIDPKALLSDINALKEAQANMAKELENKDKLLGRQSDEIGELRKQSQYGKNNQEYAEMLETNWDANEPKKQLGVVARIVQDAVNGILDQRTNSIKAFSETVGDASISFNEVEEYCAREGIPVETSNSGMRKVIDRVRISKASNVDVQAEIIKGAKDLFEKHKLTLHPGNIPPKSPGGDPASDTAKPNILQTGITVLPD